jgi:hypothetical protein
MSLIIWWANVLQFVLTAVLVFTGVPSHKQAASLLHKTHHEEIRLDDLSFNPPRKEPLDVEVQDICGAAISIIYDHRCSGMLHCMNDETAGYQYS